MTFGYDLGENCEGHFLRRDRADIQTDRSAYALQSIFVGAFFAEFIEHEVCAPLAANHADVIRFGIDGRL